ncbi:hypothetical protein Tco_0627013 [Tanacetum coccineum]|uniref:Uncharacterized protein n=1 Tax=Tanacetum coccineum TaxID=301880 RepID=A0ABQ4WL69_9ASTR
MLHWGLSRFGTLLGEREEDQLVIGFMRLLVFGVAVVVVLCGSLLLKVLLSSNFHLLSLDYLHWSRLSVLGSIMPLSNVKNASLKVGSKDNTCLSEAFLTQSRWITIGLLYSHRLAYAFPPGQGTSLEYQYKWLLLCFSSASSSTENTDRSSSRTGLSLLVILALAVVGSLFLLEP